MKFIHIADVHWGMTPNAEQSWSRERSFAIKDTFGKVINRCRELQVDFLFIAGDLFDHQPLLRELNEVNDLFSLIPNVNIVMIAGACDAITPHSSVQSFTWNPNVHFLRDETLESISFPDLHTSVWGFSYRTNNHTNAVSKNLLDSATAPSDENIHILLGYGGISPSILKDSGFSYIALGHKHKPEVVLPNQIAFSGSLEPLDQTETGVHGMFLGEIDSHSHQVSSLSLIPLASAQYLSLVIHITPHTSNEELCSYLTKEIQKRGNHYIFRFRILGKRNPKTSFAFDSLLKQFRISEIIDETEPNYHLNSLYMEHSGDMLGFYIQSMQKPNMSSVEKKALHYGIQALLYTAEKRG